MISRFIASVVACSLISGCFYKEPTTWVTSKNLNVKPVDPVHLATRLDVTLEGTTLHAQQLPICVPSKHGTYRIYREERRQLGSRAGSIVLAALGVGYIIGGIFVTDTPVAPLGYALIIMGAIQAPVFTVGSLLPKTTKKRLDPEEYEAATLDLTPPLPVCSAAEPATVTLMVRLSNGDDSFSTTAQTASNGTLALPEDVDLWASSCGKDVEVKVTTANDDEHWLPSLNPILEWRRSLTTIDNDFPGNSQVHDVANLGSDVTVELGGSAGNLPAGQYRRWDEWSFIVKSGSNAQRATGESDASRYARACYAKYAADIAKREEAAKAAARAKREQARRTCAGPKLASWTSQCEPTCGDPAKQRTCKAKYDICTDLSGAASNDCSERRDQCLEDSGQSPSRIDACVTSCVDAKIDAAGCPSL